MATTENKLLKQCKLKFANCYELSGGVPNIPVFVDKFLSRLSLGRLPFEAMYHLSGQAVLLSVVFSGIGICRCIIRGKTLGDILPFYIVSFIGLYLYFSVSSAVDVKGKKHTLKINLIDYLENHLSPRIELTRQDMEMLYGEAAFRESGGAVNQMGARGRRRGRTTASGRRPRRTVELMPISGKASVAERITPVEKAQPAEKAPSLEKAAGDDRAVGGTVNDDTINGSKTEKECRPEDTAEVTEEELEALLKEFLAT